MIKNLRYLCTLLLMAVAGVAWAGEKTESVALSAGSYDTDHITWSTITGITVQQLKGSSSTAVNSNYISAPRLYKGHILSFTALDGYAIKNISITVNGTYYGNSMTAGTAIDGTNVEDNTIDVARTWTSTSGGSHVVSSSAVLSFLLLDRHGYFSFFSSSLMTISSALIRAYFLSTDSSTCHGANFVEVFWIISLMASS